MNNVLLVHQAAELYGSDRTLLMLVEGLLAGGRWWPIILVPREGPLVPALRALGAEVHVTDVLSVSRASLSPGGVARLLAGAGRALASVDRLIAGRRVRLVHSNTLAVLAGAVWAKRRGVPHVWHVHEIVLHPAAARRAFPWLVRMFADRVVANSRQTLDWLLAQQPRLGPIAQVVCNGVTAPEHTPPEAVRRMRERAGGRDTDVLVSLVGRLNAWKGQAILLDAVARLEARGRAARLRVALVGSPFAGQEAILTELADHCRRLGLTDRVTFVPFIADIWPLWCATDIAVVPSTQPEPFGLVAIEAMAVAVPVVASGHGGLVDIVEEGRTGRLVEPGSSDALAAALEALVEDAALRRALGEAGRERQRRLFSAAAYLAGIERVYAEWEA